MKDNILKKEANLDAEYLTPRHACAVTGLSVGYIRSGCRQGRIPHLVCGQTFLVHMPSFRRMLSDAAQEGRAI